MAQWIATILGIVLIFLIGVFIGTIFYYRQREKALKEKLARWRTRYIRSKQINRKQLREEAKQQQPQNPKDFVEFLNREWKKYRQDD